MLLGLCGLSLRSGATSFDELDVKFFCDLPRFCFGNTFSSPDVVGGEDSLESELNIRAAVVFYGLPLFRFGISDVAVIISTLFLSCLSTLMVL